MSTNKELISRIKELPIQGVIEQDIEVLNFLNLTIMDNAVEPVVKKEAYLRICEANWVEVDLDNLDLMVEDYREKLISLFTEKR